MMQPHSMDEKLIKIACEGALAIPYTELGEFQGDLKTLAEADYAKLRDQIATTGFAFAPHVWKAPDGSWKLVDGHQRRKVIARMVEQEGYTVPALPCVPVEAATMEEAKHRVLQGTSQYGQMTHRGLADFIVEAGLQTGIVESSFRLPEINFGSFKFEFGDGPTPSMPTPAGAQGGPDSMTDPMGGGASLNGDAVVGEKVNQSLASRFGVPPFSVLDSRQGYWQERRRRWVGMGIRSEEGRDGDLTFAREGSTDPVGVKIQAAGALTSVFDPVLAELCYRWFCPKGGTVLDPFAGGSVRGIVANKVGLQYVGGELRAEQVEANRDQARNVCQDPVPVWHCGDSRKIDVTAKGLKADMIFSCPPYADLEVYSDDPADISNMNYADFLVAYEEIIKKSCLLLRPDAFAAWVVGEVRNPKTGNYYGFVPDTIRAFEKAGLNFYNEAILLNSLGSVPLRCVNGFTGSRKLGKCHQNVLVFVKGDAKRATELCGPIEFSVPEVAAENAPTSAPPS